MPANTANRTTSFSLSSVLMATLLVMCSSVSQAGALDFTVDPEQPILLTLSGKIDTYNQQQQLVLNEAQLKAFEQVTLTMKTRWSDDVASYTGPRLRDVLQAAGATASSVTAKAFNDYQIDIPSEDFNRYEVILAMSQDGKALSLRTKGPLWILYPWADHEELNNGTYFSRSIWQLTEIIVNE